VAFLDRDANSECYNPLFSEAADRMVCTSSRLYAYVSSVQRLSEQLRQLLRIRLAGILLYQMNLSAN
jgi:hypothetical protein